ncbi:methyltransferase domain-containing protein [Desulfosporosinus fructosivorans]|uniref:Methyltransferase domain-containing protein n=1 Tax=Desulfosporosinus fructosivorans TaxID=2018669 RepID=A0A4Z0QZ79_9FIRM|nr:class I SAM-dependent methyltransferase [Desulfosporosinus fructosivorans]TGE35385.1 methyltransferase domain-containing protein [Desulfosporosinus fructosivorans]
MKDKERNCPICGDINKKFLYHQLFGSEKIFPFREYSVVVCHNCGFGYANIVEDQDKLTKYYAQSSKYENSGNDLGPSAFDTERYELVANFLVTAGVDKSARILEVGCATGGLALALRSKGFDQFMGLDPSPLCAQIAKDLFGVEVIIGDLDSVKFESRFDVVILEAVLEHVVNIHSLINSCKKILNPGGRIYFGVPDATKFKDFTDGPFQQFSTEHINYFSPDSLENLMGLHGFTCKDSMQYKLNCNPQTEVAGYSSLWIEGICMDIRKDLQTESCLNEYIRLSNEQANKIETVISRIVDSGTEIIVWGTGTHTARLLSDGGLKKAKIIAFVDSNRHYQGEHLNDIPILPPAKISTLRQPILVSSRVYQSEIVHEIRENMKLPNEIILLY